jgi:hypothetical protein
VHLFLQWRDLADQPVGGHANPGQAKFSESTDLTSITPSNQGNFRDSRFLNPSTIVLMDVANKRREARFMVFAIEPGFVPSLEGSLQRKIKEVRDAGEIVCQHYQ